MPVPNRVFPGPPRRPGYHALLRGNGFLVQDCVCHCGRESPPSESVFAANRVALMIGGSFHYQSDFGAALLGPGSMLLGRAGGGYCFRHVDEGGDRSVAFDFSDALLAEVGHATGVGRVNRDDFARACSIPASPVTAGVTALTVQALYVANLQIWEEVALLVATAAVVSASGSNAGSEQFRSSVRRSVTWVEERMVARALRYIEAHHHQDCSLQVLADDAGMSIYRFLRVFKSLTSQTPRQYLVAIRLRAAATRLLATTDKVLEIAYDVGFGDVSHFNQAFAAAFGTSPLHFRRKHGVRVRVAP